jgi:hypothetical protein
LFIKLVIYIYFFSLRITFQKQNSLYLKHILKTTLSIYQTQKSPYEKILSKRQYFSYVLFIWSYILVVVEMRTRQDLIWFEVLVFNFIFFKKFQRVKKINIGAEWQPNVKYILIFLHFVHHINHFLLLFK